MFAQLLTLPFIILALLFLYLAWDVDSEYAPWMVPFIVIAVLLFILAPQINWWWYRRRPPVLSPGLSDMLERFNNFYQGLSEADKKRFCERVALFRMATDWTPMGFPEDTMPPDVELALAAQAVMLSFHKTEFLFPAFEKVIVYPFPFPSPEYQFAHASELYVADGCLLFSAEQVLQAFVEPRRLYNVGLHEYARVFVLAYPNEQYPAFDGDDDWVKLEQASGMSRAFVESVTGLAGADGLPVAIHHFFVFRESFKALFPKQATIFEQIFGAGTEAIT